MYTQTYSNGMGALLQSTRTRHEIALDPELASYVVEGLATKADGSIVSVAAARFACATSADFGDRVGYEAFANKLHLDDWSERLAAASLEVKLDHALMLADEVGRLAAQLDTPIAVVISADIRTADIVFRFHGVRPDERPWISDLEKFDEAILVRIYGNVSA